MTQWKTINIDRYRKENVLLINWGGDGNFLSEPPVETVRLLKP